jgi:hypothetical protein
MTGKEPEAQQYYKETRKETSVSPVGKHTLWIHCRLTALLPVGKHTLWIHSRLTALLLYNPTSNIASC